MKLWVDDIRQAPKGYAWCRSVNDAIQLIETSEKRVQSLKDIGIISGLAPKINLKKENWC